MEQSGQLVTPFSLASRRNVFLLGLLQIVALAFPLRLVISGSGGPSVSVADLIIPGTTIGLLLSAALTQKRLPVPTALVLFAALPVSLCGLSMLWSIDAGVTLSTLVQHTIASMALLNAWWLWRQMSPVQGLRLLSTLLLLVLAGSAAMYLGLPGFEFFWQAQDALADDVRLATLASVYTRLSHPFIGLSNDIAPLFSFLFFILYGSGRALHSRGLLLLSAIAALSLLLTFSRAQVAITLLIWIVAELYLRRSARTILTGAIFVSVIMLLAAFFGFFDFVSQNLEILDVIESRLSGGNVAGRLDFYQLALMEIENRWLLGYGGGLAGTTGLLTIATHNTFLELMLYYGVLPGILAGVVLAAPAWMLWNLRSDLPESSPASLAIGYFAAGWFVLLVVALTQTYFEAAVPRLELFFVLGCCYAIAIGLRDEESVVASVHSGAGSGAAVDP